VKGDIRTIAAGYRLPHFLVSGDLSEINYSSMRGELVEFRRLVRAIAMADLRSDVLPAHMGLVLRGGISRRQDR